MNESLDSRLIVALDADPGRIRELVEALPGIATFKIGMEAYYREGADLVEFVKSRGHDVFLDLKLHDIPNTVERAMRVIASLDVRFVTVHTSGGSKMLEAAVRAVAESRTQILGVTLLTSLTDGELPAVFDDRTPFGEKVERLALCARDAGCHGVVASPREAARIRRALGPEIAIVCPGIRPRGSASGDQKRSAEPAEAIEAGADFLVVGRPITGAADPARAAREISEELRAGSPS